ncbi:MAG: hypothetical protein ACYDIC_15560 [Desulfobaccales bacterium]
MGSKWKLTMIVLALGMLWAGAAFAAQVNPPQSGFAFTGFIQEATLADVGASPPADPRLRGGFLTVNGIRMTVPNNTIVQMPANTITWADLFDPAVSASVGYNPPRPNHRAGVTGLSLVENPTAGTRAAGTLGALPFPAFAISVNGNITTDPGTGAQKYIVGGLVVPLEQLPLFGGAGLINYIDYATGRFRVGGIAGNPNTGTLCEINDPVGRFGKPHSPDPRFSADTENPTIVCASGYPAGIPNVAPPAIDPDRPDYNRPVNGGPFGVDPFIANGDPLRNFTMPFKAAPNAPGDTSPDPWKQVPLKVGDWVDYGGTLFKINPLGPNTPANMFVSVHTVVAHLGIKTAPGTQPAYIFVEGFLFGVGDRTGGPTVNAGAPPTPVAQETSTRVSMVAFTTDSDANGVNLPGGVILGNDSENNASPVFPVWDPTQFTLDDPVRGRLRFQDASNSPKPPVPGLLGNATGLGNFYRTYTVQLTGAGRGVVQLPDQAQLQPNGQPLPGLKAGQFGLPIFEYIFGEGSNFGQPIPPFNYQSFGFLAVGDGPLGGPGGPHIGRLDPWPGP